jgi:hypothetical protein
MFLCLGTKHWAEIQIVSCSIVLLKEKKMYRQEETLEDRVVVAG